TRLRQPNYDGIHYPLAHLCENPTSRDTIMDDSSGGRDAPVLAPARDSSRAKPGLPAFQWDDECRVERWADNDWSQHGFRGWRRSHPTISSPRSTAHFRWLVPDFPFAWRPWIPERLWP